MTAQEEVLSGEELAVAEWRLTMLLELGLSPADAEWLAPSTVDWHEMEALIFHGCSVKLAVRILS